MPTFLTLRISQDLAKDLAMLAREIHDVAGEIDSVSPAATDPGALVKKKKSFTKQTQGLFFLLSGFCCSQDLNSADFLHVPFESVSVRGACVWRQPGSGWSYRAQQRRGVQWTSCGTSTQGLEGRKRPLHPQADMEQRGCEFLKQNNTNKTKKNFSRMIVELWLYGMYHIYWNLNIMYAMQ